MVKLPIPEQLWEISASYDLDLSYADVGSFLGFMEGAMASESLPVGTMLVGGNRDEAKIFRAARAFEATEVYGAMRREGVESAR